MNIVVCSRRLRPEEYPGVTIVSENIEQTLKQLRSQPGKDIWLFGGGELFRTLLELGYVDTVEPAVVPVLLGSGRPFLPSPAARHCLVLTGQRIYKQSGIVLLMYEVMPPAAEVPSYDSF
jgi:dihydrofolate reductase